MLNLEKHREQALIHILDRLCDCDAVLGYHQIQGLLYAMACSPEPIKPTEWFELIWLSDDAPFDDKAEARSFYRLLVDLAQDIDESADKGRYRPGLDLHGELSPAVLADWCDGFLIGHHYLENLWSIALDDLDDDSLYEQIGAALQWAEVLSASEPERDEDADEQLLTMQVQFEQWLFAYHAVHERWHRGDFRWHVEDFFEQMRPVEAEAPCPCGSGRRFAACCLH